jgi:hypothetical protein
MYQQNVVGKIKTHILYSISSLGETAKYLGLHFDRKPTWREHITKKRKRLDPKTRELKWLIGKNSPLSLENKLLIYQTILKPIWTHGIVLWGCASKSNIAIMQRYQSKSLRIITNAPWYVTNQTLHSDLHIPFVRTVIQDYAPWYVTNQTFHSDLHIPFLRTVIQDYAPWYVTNQTLHSDLHIPFARTAI